MDLRNEVTPVKTSRFKGEEFLAGKSKDSIDTTNNNLDCERNKISHGSSTTTNTNRTNHTSFNINMGIENTSTATIVQERKSIIFINVKVHQMFSIFIQLKSLLMQAEIQRIQNKLNALLRSWILREKK